jgi:hypothetical protein
LKHHTGGLLLRAFHRDEAHRRTRRCLGDGFGVRHVVLLPLHKRLHVNRRDQTNLVALGLNVARPTVRAGAGLHRHQAPRLGRQKGQKLNPGNLLAKSHRSISARSVDLKHMLRQVDPVMVAFFIGRPLVAVHDTLYLGTAMPSGASTPSLTCLAQSGFSILSFSFF